MALWVATARDIGFAAHALGEPRCMNTMCPGTPEHAEWFEGWDRAEAIESTLGERTAYISGHDGRNPTGSAPEGPMGRAAT